MTVQGLEKLKKDLKAKEDEQARTKFELERVEKELKENYNITEDNADEVVKEMEDVLKDMEKEEGKLEEKVKETFAKWL